MAVIKSKENNQGVTYEYWVAQPRINSKNKTTSVLMLGFKDKASRNEGSEFIERVMIPGELDKIYATGEEIYTFAKRSIMRTEHSEEANPDDPVVTEVESNWFADSVDDLE